VEATAAPPESVSVNSLNRSGKGLVVPKDPEDGQASVVEVDQLATSRYQKRTITPDRVRQLAETIRQAGLLQPVIARPAGGGLELVAGHRRRDAFKLLRDEAATAEERAKWSHIPCLVRLGLTEVQAAALAAVENLERDDGDPLEQGQSLLEVKRAGAFTSNAQVAAATGMNVQRVTRLIRLAESPEVIQTAVTPGVWVELISRDGTVTRERRRLELTVVLAAVPFYRHHERVTGAPAAQARTERLLVRVAKSEWTRARLEEEVHRTIAARSEEADSEGQTSEPTGAEPKAPAQRKLLFRNRGNDCVVYPRNVRGAASADLEALITWLREVSTQAEAELAAQAGSSHR
jgi:ParB/RepB/Spo0J family partition protein